MGVPVLRNVPVCVRLLPWIPILDVYKELEFELVEGCRQLSRGQ